MARANKDDANVVARKIPNQTINDVINGCLSTKNHVAVMRFSSHTCSTCINSISVVSCIADACVAAHSVITCGMFVTIVRAKCTLVDIYSVTKSSFFLIFIGMRKPFLNTDTVYEG